jgi:hypothetical protein
MKKFREIAKHVFPHDDGGIPISLLALAAAVSSCGVVAAWLWIVHFPAAISPPSMSRRDCLDQCETVCKGSRFQQ